MAKFLSNSGVNQLYKSLKSDENMKNLNSSSVMASDMVPDMVQALLSWFRLHYLLQKNKIKQN